MDVVARETLEGNLRGVLSTLTPEEVNDLRNAYEALYAINNPNDERGYAWIAGRHGFPG